MTAHPLAELVEKIAERERKSAVEDGDYVWAFIYAMVEVQAKGARLQNEP